MTLARMGLGACIALMASASAGSAPAPEPLTSREWRVGVFEAPPYAMRAENGEWRGLTVELWKELATELNLRYRFGEASPDTILDDIAHGRLDIGVAPFAATMERERLLDFSHTFLVAETGIAVRRGGDEDRWLAVIRSLSTRAALRFYLFVAALLLLAGTAMWLLERRCNPHFSGGAVRGIGSGFWWAGVTTMGVGYGDKVPMTLRGRIVALFWMFVSLILVTALIAFVTAKLAVAEFGQIRGAASLRTTTVGAVEGSASADFLRRENIHRRVYATAPRALAALRDGEVNAVVYSTSVLRYYAERDPKKEIEVLPDRLDVQNLAFPLPDGSALRDPINSALRHMMTEPGWRDMKDRYLGPEEAAASGR